MEKEHGRIEARTLESTPILTISHDWTQVRQGFRIIREITRNGKTTREIVHGITSLSVERCEASLLLELVRQHWRIENQLHYVRDVTMGEDACRVRTGNAAQSLAACRNAAITLLPKVLAASSNQAIQRLAARPEEAIALLNAQE